MAVDWFPAACSKIASALFYGDRSGGRTSESHEKDPLLGDPILKSAFGIIVQFEGCMDDRKG